MQAQPPRAKGRHHPCIPAAAFPPTNLQRMKLPLCLLTALLLTATPLGSATRAFAADANLREALGQLQAAKSSLESAKNNKGRYRTNAIKFVKQAIAEIERAMKSGQ